MLTYTGSHVRQSDSTEKGAYSSTFPAMIPLVHHHQRSQARTTVGEHSLDQGSLLPQHTRAGWAPLSLENPRACQGSHREGQTEARPVQDRAVTRAQNPRPCRRML